MHSALQTAILEFLGNEFKLDPATIAPDTSFQLDFGLSPDQLSDLFTRLQEALDFVLPEDKFEFIESVADLLAAVEPEGDGHEESGL